MRDDATVVVRRDCRAILATTRVPQRRLVDAPTLVRRAVLKGQGELKRAVQAPRGAHIPRDHLERLKDEVEYLRRRETVQPRESHAALAKQLVAKPHIVVHVVGGHIARQEAKLYLILRIRRI